MPVADNIKGWTPDQIRTLLEDLPLRPTKKARIKYCIISLDAAARFARHLPQRGRLGLNPAGPKKAIENIGQIERNAGALHRLLKTPPSEVVDALAASFASGPYAEQLNEGLMLFSEIRAQLECLQQLEIAARSARATLGKKVKAGEIPAARRHRPRTNDGAHAVAVAAGHAFYELTGDQPTRSSKKNPYKANGAIKVPDSAYINLVDGLFKLFGIQASADTCAKKAIKERNNKALAVSRKFRE